MGGSGNSKGSGIENETVRKHRLPTLSFLPGRHEQFQAFREPSEIFLFS